MTFPTQKQIEDAILKAYETIKAAKDAPPSNFGDTLSKYADSLQKYVDGFLGKKGVITQKQLDELDEQIRETKRKTLEAQSKNTALKFGIYLSVVVVTFGALYLITKNKTNG